MDQQVTEVTINGVDYIRKDAVREAETCDGLRYCIVRTYSAGVFAGYVKSRDGKEGVVLRARRLHTWAGAASLSQMAVDGPNQPDSCKFPCEVDRVELTEIIEVIPCTSKAKANIAKVPVWAA